MGLNMKIVQVTMEPDLLREVDRVAAGRRQPRSVVVRDALRRLLAQERRRALEEADRAGYRCRPVQAGEFDVFDEVVAWPPR
ncbi:MAG: ribbon-helix-helix protein, CopG family [Deltaproteobacteria bacterium]|nr:ribbon-helix-helix protein, CopG family [Deltaproteobacteria bacterium]